MKTIKARNIFDVPKSYTGIVEWNTGTLWYLKNGMFHREDGPAIESSDGDVRYYIDDTRTTKKAIELFNWLFPEQK